jgi:MFS family permease
MTDAAQLSPTYPPRALGGYVVVVLLIASLCSYLDRHVLSLVLPAIKADLAITDTQGSFLLGWSFALFYCAASIPLGWASDRFNRRNIIIAGILVWSAATIACGFAASYNDLLLARFFVGAGEAALIPAAFSMIADYFPPHQRGRALGVFSIGLFAGAGLAFIVGGAIIRSFGDAHSAVLPILGEIRIWKAAFILVGAPGALIALWLLSVPEPARIGAAQPSAGQIAAAKEKAPTLLGYFLHRPGAFFSVWGAYTLLAFVSFGTAPWAVTLMQRKFDMALSDAGFNIGISSLIGGIAGALLGGWIGDRWTARGVRGGKFRLTLAWWALALPGLLGFALLDDARLAVFCFFLFFLGNGMGYVSASAVFQDIVPWNLRGRATGVWMVLTGLIGSGLAPTVTALATDYLFKDEAALPYSLLAMGLPAIALGTILSLLGLGYYERARREIEAR